ncbi:MAG: FAD-dependent monooxygenase [Sandaracinus sp.]|nr:FAD-dependent monooxygenase [Sandaracinus sp.]
MSLDVGVVGAGYAGSAAAIHLHRAGHRVTVYEGVEKPGPVGAGILLQPTGIAVLAELGLLDFVKAHGAVVDALRCQTTSGRQVFHLPYAEEGATLHGLGLHRGVLFQALFDAVLREGIDVRLGAFVERVEHGRLVDAKGRKHGPHDLVVVADGARSELRPTGFPTILDEPYPWGAVWFVGEDRDEVFAKELFQVVGGSQTMLGFLPTGRAPGGSAPLTSLFWSLRVDALPELRRRLRFHGLHVFKDPILRREPRAAVLLDQIRDTDQLLFAAYRDVRMARWHCEVDGAQLVFLGDAAHAMSPQLGQGSNLALYDARELARSLEGVDVPRGLRRYQTRRAAHLGFYGRVNRWTTPFFQSDVGAAGAIRDAFFPLATSLPWARRQMVQVMCGTRRGFLFADPIALE